MPKGKKKKSKSSNPIQVVVERFSKAPKESECARLLREADQDEKRAAEMARKDADRKKTAAKRIKDNYDKKVKAAKTKLAKTMVQNESRFGCSPTKAKGKAKGARKAKKTEALEKGTEEMLARGVAKAVAAVRGTAKKATKRGSKKQGKRTTKKAGKRGSKKASKDKPPSVAALKAAIKRGTDLEHAEHPSLSRRMAKQVAVDHLTQDPHFYDKAKA